MRPSSLAQYATPLTMNRAILAGLQGLIATAAGRTTEAREDFQRAIALDPDPASSGYWAGQLKAVTPPSRGGVLR
jgi:predicted RNA polymerase sigma factor